MTQSIINKEIYDILSNKNLEFKKSVPDRLKCLICKSILKNAMQTECGCKDCDKCFKDYLEKGEKVCPNKDSDCENSMLQMNSINPDNATNKEIFGLKAFCIFKDCYVCLPVKELNDHIKECRFRLIICTKCGLEYKFLDESNHFSKDCSKRTVTCPDCKKNMTYDELMKTHLNVESDELCSDYVTICPNKCDIKEKVKLKEHLKYCTNQKIECPYHNLNCEAGKMTKIELIEHMEIEGNIHIGFLVNTVHQMKNELDRFKKQYQNVTNLLQETWETNKKQTMDFLKMESEFNVIKSRPAPTAIPMTMRDRTVIYRNGSYIWKITEFSTKKIDAETGGQVSIISDPFYTSEFGYKLCLKIYPAGDGVGKGTHLSVYFVIMKSEYDELLCWPFQKDITLSLLDQVSKNHHSDTLKPVERLACYQKPTDDCNIASGFPKFILLSTLLASSCVFRQCDTIYIKITVDNSNILDL